VIGANEGDDVVLSLEAMTSSAAGREMTISPAGLATISYMVKVTTITYLFWSASTGSKVAQVSTSYLAQMGETRSAAMATIGWMRARMWMAATAMVAPPRLRAIPPLIVRLSATYLNFVKYRRFGSSGLL
jgi:hypothetical protein